MEKKKEKIDVSKLRFSYRSSKIKDVYGNRYGLSNRLRQADISLRNLASFKVGADLDNYFNNPSANLENARIISDTLYTTNKVYAGIIDYLAGMYYWRYKTIPRSIKSKEKAEGDKYEEIYRLALEIVDGINIETSFPYILTSVLKNGQVFLGTMKDDKSKTVSTVIYPYQYCRPTIATQFGTMQIEFDLTFFDTFGKKGEELNEILDLFPKEFKVGYNAYKSKSGNQGKWLALPPETNTCIGLNDVGFPTYLSIFYDIIGYRQYKLNELDRSSAQLDTVLAQEYDLDKLSGVLSADEILAMHDDLAAMVENDRGVRLLTSFGKVSVHNMLKDISVENKTLKNAYSSIYDNAGINRNLFTGEIAESLHYSMKRDLVYVWNLVEKLVGFYNLTINHLYKFGGYEISLTILPISPYNENEKVAGYRQNASLGVGILDYAISTGIKQIDLESNIELEEHLKLSERLKPLQSSHTQSSTGTGGRPTSENEGDKVKEIKTDEGNESKQNKEEGV